MGGLERGASWSCALPLRSHPSRLPRRRQTQRQTRRPFQSRGFVKNLASPVRTVLSAKPRFPRFGANFAARTRPSARLANRGASRSQAPDKVLWPRLQCLASPSQPESSMSRFGPNDTHQPCLAHFPLQSSAAARAVRRRRHQLSAIARRLELRLALGSNVGGTRRAIDEQQSLCHHIITPSSRAEHRTTVRILGLPAAWTGLAPPRFVNSARIKNVVRLGRSRTWWQGKDKK